MATGFPSWQPIPMPFANNGDKNTIPTNKEQEGQSSWSIGVPPECSKDPVTAGGSPMSRRDMNGILNAPTAIGKFFQDGGTMTFSQTVSNTIGGYPKGARLWNPNTAEKGYIVRSLIDNNTDDFVTTPAHIVGNPNPNGVRQSWTYDIVTQGYVDSTFANQSLLNVPYTPIYFDGVERTGVDFVVRWWGASDGNSYYRIWRSGWIEQGGRVGPFRDNSSKVVGLPIAVNGNNVFCSATSTYCRTDDDWDMGIVSAWVTGPNQVTVYANRVPSSSMWVSWKVVGEVAR